MGEDETGRRVGREEDGVYVKGGELGRIRREWLPVGVGDAHVSPGGSKAQRALVAGEHTLDRLHAATVRVKAICSPGRKTGVSAANTASSAVDTRYFGWDDRPSGRGSR